MAALTCRLHGSKFFFVDRPKRSIFCGFLERAVQRLSRPDKDGELATSRTCIGVVQAATTPCSQCRSISVTPAALLTGKVGQCPAWAVASHFPACAPLSGGCLSPSSSGHGWGGQTKVSEGCTGTCASTPMPAVALS
jgi:hypothetical protein